MTGHRASFSGEEDVDTPTGRRYCNVKVELTSHQYKVCMQQWLCLAGCTDCYSWVTKLDVESDCCIDVQFCNHCCMVVWWLLGDTWCLYACLQAYNVTLIQKKMRTKVQLGERVDSGPL